MIVVVLWVDREAAEPELKYDFENSVNRWEGQKFSWSSDYVSYAMHSEIGRLIQQDEAKTSNLKYKRIYCSLIGLHARLVLQFTACQVTYASTLYRYMHP